MMTAEEITVNHELTINGDNTRGIRMIPASDSSYAPVKWYDQQGNIVAMIVAHEKKTDGVTVHNHLSIYTCDADRTQRKSRFDMEFGKDKPIFSFEDCRVRMKAGNSVLELRSPDGNYWEIHVDNNGALSAVPTTEAND